MCQHLFWWLWIYFVVNWMDFELWIISGFIYKFLLKFSYWTWHKRKLTGTCQNRGEFELILCLCLREQNSPVCWKLTLCITCRKIVLQKLIDSLPNDSDIWNQRNCKVEYTCGVIYVMLWAFGCCQLSEKENILDTSTNNFYIVIILLEFPTWKTFCWLEDCVI